MNSTIPLQIHNDEALHRRIHPTFVKPDGSLSSQAFKDAEMSVDRALYTTPETTLREYPLYGLAEFITNNVRSLSQEVISDPILLNPAHALVKGNKSKTVARKIAGFSRILKVPTA